MCEPDECCRLEIGREDSIHISWAGGRKKTASCGEEHLKVPDQIWSGSLTASLVDKATRTLEISYLVQKK